MSNLCPHCQTVDSLPVQGSRPGEVVHCQACGHEVQAAGEAEKPDWRSLRAAWLAAANGGPKPEAQASTARHNNAVIEPEEDLVPLNDDLILSEPTFAAEQPIRPRITRARKKGPGIAGVLRRMLPGTGMMAMAVACCALIAAVTFRNEIVAAKPSLAGLYAAAGMKVNVRGLTFDDIATDRTEVDGAPVLVVQGVIRNVTRRDIPVPPVKLTIRNKDGETVYGWVASPAKPMLAPGEELPFRSRLASPPEGDTVAIRFARQEDMLLAKTDGKAGNAIQKRRAPDA